MKRDYATDREPSLEKPAVPAMLGHLDVMFGNGPQGPVVQCTAEEDMARQEYLLSSDLSYQVQRFGVGTFPGRYGDQDFELMDLTTAMRIVQESSDRWNALPAAVRQRYGSWAKLEAAAKSGELEQLLKTSGIPAGGSGGSPEVSPSDSAAEGAPRVPKKGDSPS